MNRLPIGLAGIVVILLLAVLLSTDRRAIRLRVVGAAFGLQVALAVLVIYVPAGRAVIGGMAAGVTALLGYAAQGTQVILGPIATDPKLGASFAVSALPVIIFFAALVSVL
jgi:concentrative nucleoside transporter, CNT family